MKDVPLKSFTQAEQLFVGVKKFCVQRSAKHVLRYVDIVPIVIPKFRVTDST